MRGARIALIAGLTLIALAVGAVALERPDALARRNVTPEGNLMDLTTRAKVCQAGEVVPAGTTAVVAWLGSLAGPRVSLEILADGRVVGRGQRGSGWSSRSVMIALGAPVLRAVLNATLCFSLAPRYETTLVLGGLSKELAASTVNGKSLQGPMTIEYLRPGSATWLSQVPTIARHLGLGRDPSGAWAPILAVILAAAVIALSSILVVRRLR